MPSLRSSALFYLLGASSFCLMVVVLRSLWRRPLPLPSRPRRRPVPDWCERRSKRSGMPVMPAQNGPAPKPASTNEPRYVWLGDRIATLPLPCGWPSELHVGDSTLTSTGGWGPWWTG